MTLLSGTLVAEKIKEQCVSKVQSFEQKTNQSICLAVILVGENPASQVYVASKCKACEQLGIKHKDITLSQEITERELLEVIKTLNEDETVDGILVQLPLPKQINENKVIEAIDYQKDVDGFHPINVGKLLIGQECLVSCTPKGIMSILDYYQIQTEGKNVCIVGRSNIVGKPVAALLMQKDRNATVTICNSKTKDLKNITLNSDIIIAAVGKPNTITKEMVKEGAIVIDVGINRIADSTKKKGYRLVGDVDFANVSAKCEAITPVPGGVGPMTIATLMDNTIKAACLRRGVSL